MTEDNPNPNNALAPLPPANLAQRKAILQVAQQNARALIEAFKTGDDARIGDTVRRTGVRLIESGAEKEWIKARAGLVVPAIVHGIDSMDDKDDSGAVKVDARTGEVMKRAHYVLELFDPGIELPHPILVKGSGTYDEKKFAKGELVKMTDGRGVEIKARVARPGDLVLLSSKHALAKLAENFGEQVLIRFAEKVAVPGTAKTVWRVQILGLT